MIAVANLILEKKQHTKISKSPPKTNKQIPMPNAEEELPVVDCTWEITDETSAQVLPLLVFFQQI